MYEPGFHPWDSDERAAFIERYGGLLPRRVASGSQRITQFRAAEQGAFLMLIPDTFPACLGQTGLLALSARRPPRKAALSLPAAQGAARLLSARSADHSRHPVIINYKIV